MGQKSANIIKAQFAQAGVASVVVKEGFSSFEKILMKMHPVAGLVIQGLGHEGDCMAVFSGHHLYHVLDPHVNVAHVG